MWKFQLTKFEDEKNKSKNISMAKVGLFGIGLDTYWAQFDGLLRLQRGVGCLAFAMLCQIILK
jgi:hypothetical protein